MVLIQKNFLQFLSYTEAQLCEQIWIKNTGEGDGGILRKSKPEIKFS